MESEDNTAETETPATQLQDTHSNNCAVWNPTPETIVVINVPSVTGNHESFGCETCGKSFSKFSALERHRVVHSGIKLYPCLTCGKEFKHQHVLKNHIRLHTGDKPFVCDLCGRRFTESGHLGKHKRTHLGVKSYFCKVCGKGFTQGSGVYQHMRVVHNPSKPFRCNICGRESARAPDHVKHMKIHSKVKQFKCVICGKFFPDKEQLVTHKVVHNQQKPFPCNICGRSFRHEGVLRNHVEKNACATRYLCKICKLGFATFERLKEHKLTHKNSANAYKSLQKEGMMHSCEVCGEILYRLRDLEQHMNNIHPGCKSQICEICGCTFENLEELELHKKSHCTSDTTESVIPPVSTSNHLQHEVTQNCKVYICQVCGQGFANMRSRNTHVKTHTRGEHHSCDICGESFMTIHRLKLHKQFHSDKANEVPSVNSNFDRIASEKSSQETEKSQEPYKENETEQNIENIKSGSGQLKTPQEENLQHQASLEVISEYSLKTKEACETSIQDEQNEEDPHAKMDQSSERDLYSEPANAKAEVAQNGHEYFNSEHPCVKINSEHPCVKLQIQNDREQTSYVTFELVQNGNQHFLVNTQNPSIALQLVQSPNQATVDDSNNSCLKYEIHFANSKQCLESSDQRHPNS